MNSPFAHALRSIALAAAGLTAAGCAHRAELIEIPDWTVGNQPVPRGLRAGAARVDMTPPVGYPTGGHGPAGSVSRGYWGRLFARAFYFEDPLGHKLVLVSCETFAIPRALHFKVAESVADLGIRRAEIVLAATHTHQGPGNYLSVAAYNEFGSNKPGFDRPLFDFLVERISDAIRCAKKNAETNGDVELLVHTGSVGDIVRNRAPAPFLLNPNAASLMDALNPPGSIECKRRCPDRDDPACEPPGGWDDDQGCPRLRALDRHLTLLEIRRKGVRDFLGLLVFLAVHPTVLEHDAPFYSSDFTGVAVRTLEFARNGRETLPVIAFFNGAEGDVSPRRTQRDLRDVLGLATELRSRIAQALATPGTPVRPAAGSDQVLVDARLGDADTDSKRECSSPLWPDISIARRPVFGASAFGGGEGDRTALWDLGWKEGAVTEPRSGQGPKLASFDSRLLPDIRLTEVFAPRELFPRELPVTFARIGGFGVVAFPVEMTTAMADSIRERLSLARGQVEIIGLANEYASYVTTPHEYAAQSYEGGSTLWGPREGPYLACWLDHIRNDPHDGRESPSALERGVVFDPGDLPTTPFGPELCGDRRVAPDEELDRILLDNRRRPMRRLPWFEWEEDLDRRSADFLSIQPQPATKEVGPPPKVRILVKEGDTWHPMAVGSDFEDDRGFGMLTMLIDAADESYRLITCGGANGPTPNVCDHATSFVADDKPLRRRWAAIWISPLLKDLSGSSYRFEVQTRFNKARCSVPFAVAADGSFNDSSDRRVAEVSPGLSASACSRK